MSTTSTGRVGDHGCRDCAQDIDHCHGTLIVHPYRHTECTATDCTESHTLRHALVIDCVAVQCDCDQHIALAG